MVTNVQARVVATAMSKAATMSTGHARSRASLDMTTPLIRFVIHVRCFHLLVIVFCYIKIVFITNYPNCFAVLFESVNTRANYSLILGG